MSARESRLAAADHYSRAAEIFTALDNQPMLANIVGWSSEKVHVDTQFTRYRKDDTPIASCESLYVVTKEQGRWAIKMRSSFVP